LHFALYIYERPSLPILGPFFLMNQRINHLTHQPNYLE
jgi:hypothetical protein